MWVEATSGWLFDRPLTFLTAHSDNEDGSGIFEDAQRLDVGLSSLPSPSLSSLTNDERRALAPRAERTLHPPVYLLHLHPGPRLTSLSHLLRSLLLAVGQLVRFSLPRPLERPLALGQRRRAGSVPSEEEAWPTEQGRPRCSSRLGGCQPGGGSHNSQADQAQASSSASFDGAFLRCSDTPAACPEPHVRSPATAQLYAAR